MPKSKNRKNHSKALEKRHNKKAQQKLQIKKMATGFMKFMQEKQKEEEIKKAVEELRGKILEEGTDITFDKIKEYE